MGIHLNNNILVSYSDRQVRTKSRERWPTCLLDTWYTQAWSMKRLELELQTTTSPPPLAARSHYLVTRVVHCPIVKSVFGTTKYKQNTMEEQFIYFRHSRTPDKLISFPQLVYWAPLTSTLFASNKAVTHRIMTAFQSESKANSQMCQQIIVTPQHGSLL